MRLYKTTMYIVCTTYYDSFVPMNVLHTVFFVLNVFKMSSYILYMIYLDFTAFLGSYVPIVPNFNITLVRNPKKLTFYVFEKNIFYADLSPSKKILTCFVWMDAISVPYARHYNPLSIRNSSWILTIHKAKGHST